MEQWEREEFITKRIKEFYYEELNFCGCGNPESTLMFIKKFLNVINEKTKNYDNEDYNRNHLAYYEKHQENLIDTFEFIDKSSNNSYLTEVQNGIVQFVMYHLDNIGILEHGGSIGGAWLSEYGEEILGYLNELSDEDIDRFFM